MKELFVFGVSGLAALFIFGYSVHMFVGGLVSENTELLLIIGVVTVSAGVIGYFIWDTLRHRRY